MDCKKEKVSDSGRMFRFLLYIGSALYILFVAVLLGFDFGVYFISDARRALLDRYPEAVTAVLIFSTAVLFIPFCFFIYIDSSRTSEEIEKLKSEAFAGMNKRLLELEKTVRLGKDDIAYIDKMILKAGEEKLKVDTKILELREYSKEIRHISVYLNKNLNVIAGYSKAGKNKEVKEKLKAYAESFSDISDLIKYRF